MIYLANVGNRVHYFLLSYFAISSLSHSLTFPLFVFFLRIAIHVHFANIQTAQDLTHYLNSSCELI